MSDRYQLNDFLKDINSGKNNILRIDPEAHVDYEPYVVNMILANSIDAVLTIDVLNKYPSVDKQMQYDFLIHSLPKRNRWSKHHKKTNDDEINLISEFYNVNNAVAMTYLELLTTDQIQTIRDTHIEGGVS